MAENKSIVAEWIMIQGTAFWKEYVAELARLRKDDSRKCETDPPDRIPRYQGKCEAYDIVTSIPERVLAKFKSGL
jgi:hypothetical protein